MTIRHEIRRSRAGQWPQTWRGWAISSVIFVLCFTVIATFIDVVLDGQRIWAATFSNMATGFVFGGAFLAVQWFLRRPKRPYIDGK